MSKKHDALKERATQAIEDLFGDTTVGAMVTRDDLLELKDDIEMKIATIEVDQKIE